jgi:hypothetical protein
MFNTFRNEELHSLYSSPKVIRQIKFRRMRWVGDAARMGRKEVCKVLVGTLEGKRPLGRSRCRWEDGIRLYLGEIGWGGGWRGFNWLRIEAGGGLL